MRRYLCLLLLLAACKDNNGSCNNNMKEQYRTGAQCASDQSCPPGQICAAGNICYATCTMPGNATMMMPNSCCECCGFAAPNSGQGANCDLDLFCKPGCNPGGGGEPGCGAGSCTGGQICDTSYNVCRTPCTGGTCPTGQECVSVSTGTQTCNYCRPRGGAGSINMTCRTTGSPCDSGLTCDGVTNTCQYPCGGGGMACGPFGNCPNSYGCDPMKNICRPLCQAGACPQGGTCMTPPQSSCAICIPSGLPDGGANTPTTLATTPGANHLVIDAVNVYWTTSNDIRRCAINGCNNTPDQVAMNVNPVGIVLAGGQLFWNSGGNAIYSCSATGTCGSPTPIGQANEPGGGGIAVGNAKILWATGSHVYVCPMAGCGGPPTAIDMPGVSPQWIAFDNSNLNFYFGDGADLYSYGGGLVRTSLGAGVVVGIVADINDVFWTTRTGQVKHCTVSGCNDNPDTLVNSGGSLHGIAVDSVSIFWTDNTMGRVMKCTRANCGGSTTPVITGQNQPMDVAVDNTNVYWTNLGDGTVKKIPK